MKKLDPREKRFVEEYLKDLKPERAAIAAGYTKATAKTRSYGWVGDSRAVFHKPHLAAAIKRAQERRSKRTEITQDRVLEEYARIGFADIRNVVNWGSQPEIVDADPNDPDGDTVRVFPVELRASEGMTPDIAATVAEVSSTPSGGIRVKMHDKKAALDSMAKHLGMFAEGASVAINPTLKVEVNVREEFINRILSIAARSRAAEGS